MKNKTDSYRLLIKLRKPDGNPVAFVEMPVSQFRGRALYKRACKAIGREPFMSKREWKKVEGIFAKLIHRANPSSILVPTHKCVAYLERM